MLGSTRSVCYLVTSCYCTFWFCFVFCMLVFAVCFCYFFFSSRRRHTRCSRDWSSDVCSSDLFFDFHQAHAACRLERQAGIVTERWHFRSDAPRRLDDQRTLRHLHFAVVNLQLDELLIWHGVLAAVLCLCFWSFTLPGANERAGGFIWATPPQMTFKLSAPFLHDADGRHGRGVAERTEGSPKHVFGKVRDEIGRAHV